MSNSKKQIRASFRDAVFKRDKYSCVICGLKAQPTEAENILDAHHIIPRQLMPNGGYCKENGITLCKKTCHLKAESYTLHLISEFSPTNLFNIINSSESKAIMASENLKI